MLCKIVSWNYFFFLKKKIKKNIFESLFCVRNFIIEPLSRENSNYRRKQKRKKKQEKKLTLKAQIE